MTNDTLNHTDMELSDIACNAKDTLNKEATNRYNQAKDIAKKATGTAREYVTQNPIKTVAITLGVGLLVGLLVSRRS